MTGADPPRGPAAPPPAGLRAALLEPNRAGERKLVRFGRSRAGRAEGRWKAAGSTWGPAVLGDAAAPGGRHDPATDDRRPARRVHRAGSTPYPPSGTSRAWERTAAALAVAAIEATIELVHLATRPDRPGRGRTGRMGT